MKRLLYLLLFITTAVVGQSPPDSTQVTPGTSFTPQWRYNGANASDGVNQFRNPLNGKWFSVYSSYQTKQLFAPISASTYYIQNQNTLPQPTSNFWIDGVGQANSFQAYNISDPSTYSTMSTNSILTVSGDNAGALETNGVSFYKDGVSSEFSYVDANNTKLFSNKNLTLQALHVKSSAEATESDDVVRLTDLQTLGIQNQYTAPQAGAGLWTAGNIRASGNIRADGEFAVQGQLYRVGGPWSIQADGSTILNTLTTTSAIKIGNTSSGEVALRLQSKPNGGAYDWQFMANSMSGDTTLAWKYRGTNIVVAKPNGNIYNGAGYRYLTALDSINTADTFVHKTGAVTESVDGFKNFTYNLSARALQMSDIGGLLDAGQATTAKLFIASAVSDRELVTAYNTYNITNWTWGQNAARDMRLVRYNTSGTVIDTVFKASKSNGNIGIGASPTSARLTIGNGETPIASSLAGTILHVVNTAGTDTRVLWDTYGSGSSIASKFVYRKARGNPSAATAVQSGDPLVFLTTQGYGTDTYGTGSQQFLNVMATENFTNTAGGRSLNLSTVPNGSLTPVPRISIANDGVTTIANTIINTNTAAGTAGTDSLLVKVDASNEIRRIAANYYLPTTIAASTYVPYTGATTNINLNLKSITNALGITATVGTFLAGAQIGGGSPIEFGHGSTYKTRLYGTFATQDNDVNIQNGSGTLAFLTDITAAQTQIVEISGTSQAGAVNTIYIPHNAALTTITLPASATVGQLIQIIGEGAGGWKLAQNASQQIVGVGVSTTTGTGGFIQSTDANCTLSIRCTGTNKFTITSSQGTLTIN